MSHLKCHRCLVINRFTFSLSKEEAYDLASEAITMHNGDAVCEKHFEEYIDQLFYSLSAL